MSTLKNSNHRSHEEEINSIKNHWEERLKKSLHLWQMKFRHSNEHRAKTRVDYEIRYRELIFHSVKIHSVSRGMRLKGMEEGWEGRRTLFKIRLSGCLRQPGATSPWDVFSPLLMVEKRQGERKKNSVANRINAAAPSKLCLPCWPSTAPKIWSTRRVLKRNVFKNDTRH